ncbi:MAG TPA: metal-binding protein [Phycisphaerales bacterium]|nr:metal-binding protein [Phycisphaerales bacterium]
MFERMPERVNPFRLVDAGRRLQGRVALSRLKRLAPALLSDEGEVAVRLEFSRNTQGLAMIRGRVEAVLELGCQRCMQAMRHVVDEEFTVAVVETDAEAEMVQEQYDPLLVEDEALMLIDLIEDELLLVMPLAPMHPEQQDCVGRDLREFDPESVGEPVEEKDNPFAVLKTLKPN